MGVVIPYYSQIEVNLMITKFFNRFEMAEYFEIKTSWVLVGRMFVNACDTKAVYRVAFRI